MSGFVYPPSGGGAGTVSRVQSTDLSTLTVANPTGPTVTLTALAGAVAQLLAGANIVLSPATGKGDVTVGVPGPVTFTGDLTVQTATEIVLGSTTAAQLILTVGTSTALLRALIAIVIELSGGSASLRMSSGSAALATTGGSSTARVEASGTGATARLISTAYALIEAGLRITLVVGGVTNSLFTYSGNPNGHVAPGYQGSICLTPTALWRASGVGETTWHPLAIYGTSGITFTGTTVLVEGTEIILAYRGANGTVPHGVQIASLTGGEYASTISVYPGNPNGHVEAAETAGDLCIDVSTPALWQATASGKTSWVAVGGGATLDVTVNSDAVTSSGLLPLQITKQPLVPPSGIPQPLPPLFGFQFPGTFTPFKFNTTPAATLRWMAAGRDGNLWGTTNLTQVVVFSVFGELIDMIPVTGAFGICSGSDGTIWVTSETTKTFHRIDVTTHAVTPFTLPATAAAIHQICSGPDRHLYIADTFGKVWQVDPTSTPPTMTSVTVLGTGTAPVCAGPDGNVWVFGSTTGAGDVKLLDPATLTVVATHPLPATSRVENKGACTGPDDNVWTCLHFTTGKTGVCAIAPDGTIVHTLSTAKLTVTTYQVVAGAGGDLWATVANSTAEYGLVKITVEGDVTFFPTGQKTALAVGQDGAFWAGSATTTGLHAVQSAFLVQTGGLVLTALPTADPHNKGEIWNTITATISTLRVSAG